MADRKEHAAARYSELEENFGFTEDGYKEFVDKVANEFSVSEDAMESKFSLWTRRYKLLNNQAKDSKKFSDPLAFKHFKAIQAGLYANQGRQTFSPRSQEDMETAEVLNRTAEYDYQQMGMDEHSFSTIFYSLLCGRALVLMMEYDRENMVPVPEVINPMTWYRDPMATSVNGDQKGNGAMRFGYRPLLKTKEQMDDAGYKNVKNMACVDVMGDDSLDIMYKRTKEAKGISGDNADWLENRQLLTYEGFTWWKGKRYFVVLDGGQTVVLKFIALPDKEWPIVDYPLFPDPNSWDGVSLMDLLEDKQRINNAVLNAAAFGIQANQYPMYAVNTNSLTQKSDLNFAFNKHIPVDVPIGSDPSSVIRPIQRSQVNNEVQWLLEYNRQSAESTTGASSIAQGAIAGAKRTATEIAQVAAGSDTQLELMSKTLAWGERRFWQMWYKLHKRHFKEFDKKTVRINGASATRIEFLTRDKVITKVDPDVRVESAVASEARKIRRQQTWANMFNILINDPNINRDYLFKQTALNAGATQMEIDEMFKPDAQTLLQRKENEDLAKGKKVPINGTDDDIKHLAELNKLPNQNSKAVVDHRERHQKAYLAKNSNPLLKQEVKSLEPELPRIQATVNTEAPKTLDTA